MEIAKRPITNFASLRNEHGDGECVGQCISKVFLEWAEDRPFNVAWHECPKANWLMALLWAITPFCIDRKMYLSLTRIADEYNRRSWEELERILSGESAGVCDEEVGRLIFHSGACIINSAKALKDEEYSQWHVLCASNCAAEVGINDPSIIRDNLEFPSHLVGKSEKELDKMRDKKYDKTE